MKPGLLLISGGIDSVTLAYVLKRAGALRGMMFIDYGQASAQHQFNMVQEHASILGVETLKRESISWPVYARGAGYIFTCGKHPKPMTDPYAPVTMTKEEYDTYLKDQWDFIQGRNIIFLTHACSYAVHLGLATVYTAFQFDPPEWKNGGVQGCDTSPQFVQAFNALAGLGGFSKHVRVECPFLDSCSSKKDIVRMARMHGVRLSATYSCEFFPACGSCHQCLIRKDVLAKPGKSG